MNKFVSRVLGLVRHHPAAMAEQGAAELEEHILFGTPRNSCTCTKASFLKGMLEFLEGEVSVICRKIILIHGQGPGVCYLEVKRFK